MQVILAIGHQQSCTRSYVSILMHRTRYSIIQKRGCEAGRSKNDKEADGRNDGELVCSGVLRAVISRRQAVQCSAIVYQDPGSDSGSGPGPGPAAVLR